MTPGRTMATREGTAVREVVDRGTADQVAREGTITTTTTARINAPPVRTIIITGRMATGITTAVMAVVVVI